MVRRQTGQHPISLSLPGTRWQGFEEKLKNYPFQQHEMKLDYETIALKKAEGKGPKEVAQYKKKLAKDIRLATKALKA